MKKQKLNMQGLKVSSFKTSAVKGGYILSTGWSAHPCLGTDVFPCDTFEATLCGPCDNTDEGTQCCAPKE